MIIEHLMEQAMEKGAPDQYLDWLRLQPSCLSDTYSEYVNGEGRCVAAHVRRSWNSGKGQKPDYFAVPLTFGEHMIQHSQGEDDCINAHRRKIKMPQVANDEAKEIFDTIAKTYLELWMDS